MDKIEPCLKFDDQYATDLSEQVKTIVSDLNNLNERLVKTRLDCEDAIKEALAPLSPGSKEEKNFDDSLREIVLPWIHELYKNKLIIKYNIKCIMFFIEMKCKPFIVCSPSCLNTDSANKNAMITSIINTLSSFSSELIESNEYKTISELPSGVLSLTPTLGGVLGNTVSENEAQKEYNENEMKKIRQNVFIERAYSVMTYCRTYSYMMHVMQKAVYSVRKMTTDYKTTDNDGVSNPMMYI